jgi:hypothetical protein
MRNLPPQNNTSSNQTFCQSFMEASSSLAFVSQPYFQPWVSALRVNDPTTGWQLRPVQDLIMIQGDKGYCWLYWRDGSRHITAYPLKHYEDKLPVSQYVRIHQTNLVNIDFIRKVQLTHKGPQLILSNGAKLTISRRRWIAVKRQLTHLF